MWRSRSIKVGPRQTIYGQDSNANVHHTPHNPPRTHPSTFLRWLVDFKTLGKFSNGCSLIKSPKTLSKTQKKHHLLSLNGIVSPSSPRRRCQLLPHNTDLRFHRHRLQIHLKPRLPTTTTTTTTPPPSEQNGTKSGALHDNRRKRHLW
jgi:hypothetical protein